MKTFIKKQKGFSLVETLVAVAILTIGIAGPLTAVFRALNSAEVAKAKISAFYFAQEGIETIRYIRDTNILDSMNPDWLSYLNSRCEVPPPGGNTPCMIQNVLDASGGMGQRLLHNCMGGGCTAIRYDISAGLYGRGGGMDDPFTVFTRSITAKETIPAGREAEIVVTVDWSLKGMNYSYVLQETMFNWSDN